MNPIDRKIRDLIVEKNQEELTLGFLRYEALRKLNVKQYSDLVKNNLAGKNFDELVDELVRKTCEEY